MLPVLSPEQARCFDQFAAQVLKLPTAVLMENAGAGAARVVAQELGPGSRVLVFCGSGNNGGDGLVLARHLRLAGHAPTVILLSPEERFQGAAAANLSAYRDSGGALGALDAERDWAQLLIQLLRATDVVVDAALGTGLSRPLAGRLRDWVEALNAAGKPIWALDLPTGLCAHTGASLPVAIRAVATLTFGHPKPGLLTPQALPFVGRLVLIGLGVCPDLGPGAQPIARLLEPKDARGFAEPRPEAAHKGSAGRVLVLAGSRGTVGAALLAGRAALRAGAGLVTLASFEPTASQLQGRVPELMVCALDSGALEPSLMPGLERAQAVVVGPGFGLGEPSRRALEFVLSRFEGPVVVDADALTLLARDRECLRSTKARCLFTPHPGEMARLLGLSVVEVERDRFLALKSAVDLLGHTLLLKGAQTLIGAPGEPPWVVFAGHRSLATAGSGDVLAGVIGALATTLPIQQAAALGCVLQGLSARLWSRQHGGVDRGLLAGEVSDCLPQARAGLLAAAPGFTRWPLDIG